MGRERAVEFYGDYHTHTNYSDAKQGLIDIVEAARNRGLKEVAITDHGPLAAVIGVSNPNSYLKLKEEINLINEEYDDIKVLLGAEANIRNIEGDLDIPPYIIKELDILIAGLHPYTLPTSIKAGVKIFLQNSLRHLGKGCYEKAVKNNTQAVIAAMKNNPSLDILAHPGLFFKLDIAEVAQVAVKERVLFEINCGHEYPKISDIMEADKYGINFIVNSDAHLSSTVGDFSYAKRIIKKLNLDEARIVNSSARGGYKTWVKN